MDWTDRNVLIGNGLLVLCVMLWSGVILHLRVHRQVSDTLSLVPWYLVVSGLVAGLSCFRHRLDAVSLHRGGVQRHRQLGRHHGDHESAADDIDRRPAGRAGLRYGIECDVSGRAAYPAARRRIMPDCRRYRGGYPVPQPVTDFR